MESVSLAPEYWGSSTWKTMFSIAYAYPPVPTKDERVAANNYFNSLKYLLPCADCRQHYRELLKSLPVEKSTVSKVELLKWLEEVSNRVNKMLEKDQIKFQKIYEEMSRVKTVQIIDIPVMEQSAPRSGFSIQRAQASRGIRSAQPVKKSGCGCGKNRKK